VTKDISDYTIVQGVPAKSSGWISRHGHKLEKKDGKGVYTCPESGLRYRETSGKKLICIEIEENMGLPKEMRTGKMGYEHYKNIQ